MIGESLTSKIDSSSFPTAPGSSTLDSKKATVPHQSMSQLGVVDGHAKNSKFIVILALASALMMGLLILLVTCSGRQNDTPNTCVDVQPLKSISLVRPAQNTRLHRGLSSSKALGNLPISTALSSSAKSSKRAA